MTFPRDFNGRLDMVKFERANEATQESWLQEIENKRDALKAAHQTDPVNAADCAQLRAHFDAQLVQGETERAALSAQEEQLKKQILHLKKIGKQQEDALVRSVAKGVEKRSAKPNKGCVVS